MAKVPITIIILGQIDERLATRRTKEVLGVEAEKIGAEMMSVSGALITYNSPLPAPAPVTEGTSDQK